MATEVKIVKVGNRQQLRMNRLIRKWEARGYELDRVDPAKGLTGWTYLIFRKS
jgi:DNA phosphorothioation-dependent restriction protein DptG